MNNPPDEHEVATRIASLTQRIPQYPAAEEEDRHDDLSAVLGLDAARRQALADQVRAESAAARHERAAEERRAGKQRPAEPLPEAPPSAAVPDRWARELADTQETIPIEDRQTILEFWGTFWTQARHALLLRIEREDPQLRGLARHFLDQWQPPE